MKLADFEGVWDFDRVIADALTGGVSMAKGTAEIAGGIYTERTALTLPDGTVLNGTRTYLWSQSSDGITIRFDDGREFHTMQFDTPQAEHWCDPDTYDVVYDFTAFPEWSASWTVKGPRKDYKMVTRYHKQVV